MFVLSFLWAMSDVLQVSDLFRTLVSSLHVEMPMPQLHAQFLLLCGAMFCGEMSGHHSKRMQALLEGPPRS